MTDAEKTERLARVLWWAHWDGQPPYEWDAEPGRATDWRNTAIAALTWLDSLEDGPAALQAKVREMAMQNLADLDQAQEAWEAQKAAEAERDALRAEVERLRGALQPFASFANGVVDDAGWVSLPMRERIVDWFGPGDFCSARAALGTAHD